MPRALSSAYILNTTACAKKTILQRSCEFDLANFIIGSISKIKKNILRSFKEDGENILKIGKVDCGDVDAALFKSFKQCRSSNILTSGQLTVLQEKANRVCKDFWSRLKLFQRLIRSI